MLVERTRGLLAMLLLLAACGGAPPPVPPDRDHVGGVVDESDRCPYLPRECLAGFDPAQDDGCPDPPPPEIELPGDSVALPGDASRVLDAVAADVRQLAAGTALILLVERLPRETDEEAARRGALVATALVQRGAPADRICVEPVPADEASARVVIGVAGCEYGAGLPDRDGEGLPDHREVCLDHLAL